MGVLSNTRVDARVHFDGSATGSVYPRGCTVQREHFLTQDGTTPPLDGDWKCVHCGIVLSTQELTAALD